MSTFLTYIFGLIVIGGVLFLLTSFAFGRGEEMAPMPPPGVPVELPDGRPVVAEDVHALRLSVVLRGYRMEEVDWVLDALALELKDRDAIIADLRRQLAGEPDEPVDTGTDPALPAGHDEPGPHDKVVAVAEPARPDLAEPDLAEPELVQPELVEPEPVGPESGPAGGGAAAERAEPADGADAAAVNGTARERVDG